MFREFVSKTNNTTDINSIRNTLETNEDIEKRCDAAKELIESGDPGGIEVFRRILNPSYELPAFLEIWKAIMIAIRDESRKRGYNEILLEFGDSGNKYPSNMEDVIVMYYEKLKEDTA
ncbi:MAG: hypothetical protein PHI35_07985 [Victivallaceae bacterium]|nr:hypothetical protein [Victivallaceae bacterium]